MSAAVPASAPAPAPPTCADPRHGGPGPDTAACFPHLVEVAEIAHRATADQPVDHVVTCSAVRQGFDFALWPVPTAAHHPTDALVGWRPPAGTGAVGLVASGATAGGGRTAGSSDSGDPELVRVTVLAGACGATATVLEVAGGPAETILEPPQGWGSDALRRCLALPTPPPEESLVAWIEGRWITAVAELTQVLEPGRATWRAVALLHPLHPPGVALAPSQLGDLTTELEATSSWERMLSLAWRAPEIRHPADAHPPTGGAVPLQEWFDAGSFCRWSFRRLPDLDQLLLEVLDELPDPVGRRLLDALVSLA